MAEYTFEGQRPDEEVIFVQKRHPWVLSKAGIIGILIILGLIISFILFGFSKVTSLMIVITVIFFVFYGLYLWFLYNNYIYILTNQRVIIIEQNSIFSRRIIESELDKIQNISVEVKGPVKTFLNFGDLKIMTAGIDPIMVILNVENPYKVQQEIVKHCKKLTGVSNQTIIR